MLLTIKGFAPESVRESLEACLIGTSSGRCSWSLESGEQMCSKYPAMHGKGPHHREWSSPKGLKGHHGDTPV